MSLLDLVGELGTLAPWLYRDWLYLLSSRYRRARHDAWRNAGLGYATGDIILSVAVVLAEVISIILLGSWIIETVGQGR